MPRFKFTAMDPKGVETEGVLDAENQSEAVALIRSKGSFPTKITELAARGSSQAPAASARAAAPAAKAGTGLKTEIKIKMPRLFKARVKPKNLMVFTRQLATLVEAGVPLLRGLRILLQQEKNVALRESISGMGEAVESGSTFSEALAMYPKIFDKLYVNMVKAGEAGGVLDVVLQRTAEFLEKAERIKRKVKSAMVYPVVVLVAAVGILIFMLTRVIPKFAEIFQELLEGKQLPALTQFVINLSNTIRQRGLFVLGGIFVIVVVLKMAGRSPRGRFVLDKIKLKSPLFGPLLVKTAVARFARTLGTLMSSGVPVLQALNIVRDTAGNEVIARAIQEVHDSVKEGDTMTMPLEASGVFPEMVVSMVDVGEETGALPEMLVRVADNYDEEVDVAVESLTSVIEPIMIIMLAFIIGTIVIAMFVPLIDIITSMGSGGA